MIPLRDESRSASVPLITRGIIVLNVVAFLYEVLLGPDLRAFMYEWGLVPLRLTLALSDGAEPVTAPGTTLLTSMFLHGGWLHLIGNMWYMHLFGDNVEDRLGKLGFTAFYLGGGMIAGLFHYIVNPQSPMPTVGASGAVAAVLGAYVIAFPRARIITLVPIFPFVQVMALPALLVLGFWFVFQFFSGALSLAGGGGAGVAWWAHIGGFVFGAIAMRALGRPRSRETRV